MMKEGQPDQRESTSTNNYNKRFTKGNGYHGSGGLTTSKLEDDYIFNAIFLRYLLKLQTSEKDVASIDIGIADFGCGDGRYLVGYQNALAKINQYDAKHSLPELRLKIVGFDLSSEGVERFNEKASFLEMSSFAKAMTSSEDISETLDLMATSLDDQKDIVFSGYGSLSSVSASRSQEFLAGFKDRGFGMVSDMAAINGFGRMKLIFNLYRQDLLEGATVLDKNKLYETEEGQAILIEIAKGHHPQYDQDRYLDLLPKVFARMSEEQGEEGKENVFCDPGSFIYLDSCPDGGNPQFFYHTSIDAIRDNVSSLGYQMVTMGKEFLQTHKIAILDQEENQPLLKLDKLSNYFSNCRSKEELLAGVDKLIEKCSSSEQNRDSLELVRLKAWRCAVEFTEFQAESFMQAFDNYFPEYAIYIAIDPQLIDQKYITPDGNLTAEFYSDLNPVAEISKSAGHVAELELTKGTNGVAI